MIMMTVVVLLVLIIKYCKLSSRNGYKWMDPTVAIMLSLWKRGVGGWEVGDGVCEELGDDDDDGCG